MSLLLDELLVFLVVVVGFVVVGTTSNEPSTNAPLELSQTDLGRYSENRVEFKNACILVSKSSR